MGRISKADLEAGVKPKKYNTAWRRDIEKQKLLREQRDANPPKCAFCGRVIGKDRRYKPNIKYCSQAHSKEARNVNKAEKRKEAELLAAVSKLPVPQHGYSIQEIRRGPIYDTIKAGMDPDEWDRWIDRLMLDTDVALRFGCSSQMAGMVRKAGFNDRLIELANELFTPTTEHLAMLGPSDDEMRQLLIDDPDAFEAKLDVLVDAFVDWRNEFFTAGIFAYITRLFHRNWIRSVLRTIYTGGRTLILSPPRHGKTELLCHFCVWLICRNPNIRILWVGPNGPIAENCLGLVKDLLEGHEELRYAYLGANRHWAPERRGSGLWKQDKFRVENRGHFLKQPTMWCAGVDGKILSIDADFIIVDDPADPDDSQTVGGREKISKRFKQKLITRKMAHTGLAMIASRVHPDDLHSEYVDSERWEVIVDKAHDDKICGLDMFADHDDTESCVLFSELNPLYYLREQADDVGASLFEMMYQNEPQPEGTLIFNPEVIKERCLDRSRETGTAGIAGGYRLIAGLDPAARGVQAAFCWAVQLPPELKDGEQPDPRSVTTDSYYMVDTETQQAGGIEGAERVMREWYEKYDLRTWVIEDNAHQTLWHDDPRIRKVAAELGLEIRPTTTGRNKHDPDFGVAAMAPLFHEGKVNLPYAGLDAQRKTDAYVRQLTNFTGEVGRSKRKSDILMAAWFPFATHIKRWKRGTRTAATHNYARSFPGYDRATRAEVPWGRTQYPR